MLHFVCLLRSHYFFFFSFNQRLDEIMKRTRKTDGGEKVRFEIESKQHAKTLTLQ